MGGLSNIFIEPISDRYQASEMTPVCMDEMSITVTMFTITIIIISLQSRRLGNPKHKFLPTNFLLPHSPKPLRHTLQTPRHDRNPIRLNPPLHQLLLQPREKLPRKSL